MNNELATYRKSIINRSFWLGAGLGILLVILGYKPYALGVIIGVFVAAINFFLLSLDVFRIAGGARKGSVLFSFLIRYILLGAAIYLVIRYPEANIFGFLIGYFILQANIFITSFLKRSNLTKTTNPSEK